MLAEMNRHIEERLGEDFIESGGDSPVHLLQRVQYIFIIVNLVLVW